jgi:hypothetical protein
MSHATTTGMDSITGKQNNKDLRRMMVATGNLLGVKQEKTLVLKAFENEELFPRCNFLQPEDLGTNGLVSKKVRKHMNYYKRDEWEQPWKAWAKRVTKRAIIEKRNGIVQSIANQEAKSKQQWATAWL